MLRQYQAEAVEALINAKGNDVVTLPTGSGKSHVISGFCEAYPGNILILSHVSEILEQNFSKLSHLPDVGLYSAGLGVKHIGRVTVAGIQSVYRHPDLFRHVDKILIDEAHLVSNEGMYKSFLNELGVPYLGLTATDFRTKGGYIHGPDGMFSGKCYEVTVKKLTKEGFLCPLVYYSDKEPLDTTGVKLTGGDFNLSQMSMKFNRSAITDRIAEQIAAYPHKHILAFCIDIDHADNLAASLRSLGVSAAAVHSKSNRDQAIMDFKLGKIRVLTNVNILTTGFDFPAIDMIAVVRPTKSMGLHQQMLGRGMRLHLSKTETLIKDFTSNTKLLGTVSQPAPLRTKSTKGTGGEPWLKSCGKCDLLVFPAVRVCPDCGFKFKFEHHLNTEAHQEIKLPKWYKVDFVRYFIHHKNGSPDSLKINYQCGMKNFTQYVTLDHPGFPGHKARHWVNKRYKGTAPKTVKDLYTNSDNIKTPKRVQVDESSKYPRILQTV